MPALTDVSIKGKVYVVGDNIDTDQIIPAQYLNLVPTIPEEYARLGSHAFSGLPPEYPPFVASGKMKSEYSIVVAGRNFGCGSSREHAPVALAAAGVKAVIAESYARIFFRNAIATGAVYPFETAKPLRGAFRTGEEAGIELAAGRAIRCATGEAFPLAPLGDAAEVIAAGGLFNYARKTGMLRQSK